MFKFNFNNDSELPVASNKRPSAPEIACAEAKEHFLDDKHLELLSENLAIRNFEVEEGRYINYVDSEIVAQNIKKECANGLGQALKKESDLVPGVYEGGLKIWECAYDLVKYLHRNSTNQDWIGKNVLELGCGAGLPCLYCLIHGANVLFQDYNSEVIDHVTIPNVLLNAPEPSENGEAAESRFFSGDWTSVEKKFVAQNIKFDVILTSETIYSERNQQKLLSIFDNCLKTGGRIYVSSKTHYFGVGGGLRQFEECLKSSNIWQFQVVFKETSEVQREIILITRKKNNTP